MIDEILKQAEEKKRTEEMLRQGRIVFQLLNHPGWPIVEAHLEAAKTNANIIRRKSLGKTASGDNALYYSGIVDGVEMAEQTIRDIVLEAQKIQENKENEND